MGNKNDEIEFAFDATDDIKTTTNPDPDWDDHTKNSTWNTICRTKDNKYVVVDTQWNPPPQNVYETMVFDSDENGNISLQSYKYPIDVAYYHEEREAEKAHRRLCEKWEAKIRYPKK